MAEHLTPAAVVVIPWYCEGPLGNVTQANQLIILVGNGAARLCP